eukprot:TRINITY_DN24816_c0_g1_i1.p1 TRINITY_DN24816_c0_g1~~TRINITY_DN24816_c0_g1_i1.p1  ORF type:complete len:349 (-),score=56.92 TRINITY_DN24816_c0_g1_i1:152-1198(-)
MILLFYFFFVIFRSEARELNRLAGQDASSTTLVAANSKMLIRPSSSTTVVPTVSSMPMLPQLHLSGSSMAMPPIGFGTCCRPSAKGKALIQSASIYLAAGGRLIDTAQMYRNHKDLAVAIRKANIPRAELWVTSKVNNRKKALAQADVVNAVEESLEELGLDYIDLMLLHQSPTKWRKTNAEAATEWKGLIEAQKSGKVRSIGVANFNREEIENLIAQTGVTPASNQIEFHPWVPLEMKELVKWCQSRGIAVTAYGSLGSSFNKASGAVVDKIAQANRVSNAEVLLRWALDKEVAVIPGATSEDHIKENLQIASSTFHLSPDDSLQLEGGKKPAEFRRWHNIASRSAS